MAYISSKEFKVLLEEIVKKCLKKENQMKVFFLFF